MTRASIREYSEAVRWRYLQAPKKEKSLILDEYCGNTGQARKDVNRKISNLLTCVLTLHLIVTP